MTLTKNQIKFVENLYDYLRGSMLFDDEARDNEWGKLTRKHYREAKKEIREYLVSKNIEWSGDSNTIKIGKHLTIYITN